VLEEPKLIDNHRSTMPAKSSARISTDADCASPSEAARRPNSALSVGEQQSAPAAKSEFVIRRVGQNDLSLWQEFVDRSPEAGCMHHAGWYNILKDAFAVEPFFFMALDGDATVQGILALYRSGSLFTGRHISSLEGGMLASSPQAAYALYSAARDLRDDIHARYLQIRGRAFDDGIFRVIPTVHTVIPTCRPAHLLWAAVKKKTRWAVRQNSKLPISVEHDPSLNELESFYRLYAERMHALGTPIIGFAMFDSMRSRLGSRRLRLYIVKHNGSPIGGMLCIVNNQRWTDQFAIVRPSDEAEFANYLLYWHVIRDASTCNVPALDLGRSTPNSNVHLFKRKWGGIDIEIPYYFYANDPKGLKHLRLETMKRTHGLAQIIWSRLPLPVCNRIGPLLRRQLPFI
jgi:hypothetical protein